MKTTKKHFDLFEQECRKWIKFFGLLNWKLYFYHESINAEALASTGFNLSGRVASIRLNTDWPKEDLHERGLRETAFHESCEVLLARVTYYMGARFVSDEGEIQEAAHEIIRTLENVVFNGR